MPNSIEIIQGESFTLNVTRIESSLAIGNDLDIALRQMNNLSFVTIFEETDSSKVIIDTGEVSIRTPFMENIF